MLPYLSERLQGSAMFPSGYHETVSKRMQQIPSTINFLWSWGLDGAEAVFRLRHSTSPERWRHVERNLCRFQADRFHALGRSVRSLLR